MTLSSAINLGRLFSVDEVQSILQAAMNQLTIDARDNSELYSEIDMTTACPEKSCSVEEMLLAVTTAIWEYFNNTLWEEFEDFQVYAVR